MNKLFFTLSFIFISTTSHFQITILGSHLPDSGDTLVTRAATLLVDTDPETTGADHVWNFGFDVLQPQNLNADVVCYDVSSTSFFDQILFNNPFDPDHDSDFGIGVQQADIASISFEDAYQFYKNGGGVYSITGTSATINSIPLSAQMFDTDVIYDIPLNFNMNGTSNSLLSYDIPDLGYYGADQTRTYNCDGWGTLNIYGLSFDVLRVRSVINATDSIYTSLLGQGFGFSIPRPESITYEWLSTQYKVPVLKITTTAGTISQIQTADIYVDPNLIATQEANHFKLFPNPVQNQVSISGLNGGKATVQIYSGNGQLLFTQNAYTGGVIDLSDFAAGIYCVAIQSEGLVTSQRLIKE